MGDKRVLIYLPPPADFSKEIFRLNKLISAKYKNSYMEHVDFEWQSHLMVYLSPMPDKNLEKLLSQVKEITKQTTPFTVRLGKIIKTSEGFIYIEAEAPELIDLREQIVAVLSSLRGETIKTEYLQKWDSFTIEQQQRIKDTGLPYVYQPHLTIAKLSPQEVDLALEVIKDISFVGKSFTAQKLLVTQESDLASADWPILAEFELSKK